MSDFFSSFLRNFHSHSIFLGVLGISEYWLGKTYRHCVDLKQRFVFQKRKLFENYIEYLEIIWKQVLKRISGYSGRYSGFSSPFSKTFIYLDLFWTPTSFIKTTTYELLRLPLPSWSMVSLVYWICGPF